MSTLLLIQQTLLRTERETGRFGVIRAQDAPLEAEGLRPASHYLRHDGTFTQAGREALVTHDANARHIDGDRLSWLRTHVMELPPEARPAFIEAQSTRDRLAGQRGLSHYMNADGSLEQAGVQRLRDEEQADRARRRMHADEIRRAQFLLRGLEAEARQEGNAGLQTEMWLQLCAYLRRNGIQPRQPPKQSTPGAEEEMRGKAFVTERGESTKKGKQVKRSEAWNWATIGTAFAAITAGAMTGAAASDLVLYHEEENIFDLQPFNFLRPAQPSPRTTPAGQGPAESELPEYVEAADDEDGTAWIQPPPHSADAPPSYG